MTVEESGQRGNTSGEENRIERYIRTDGTSVAEPEPRFFYLEPEPIFWVGSGFFFGE